MSDQRPGRPATIADVAARAGVSFKTVSRVVNDEPGVSPALIERVRRRNHHGPGCLRRPHARASVMAVAITRSRSR